MIERSTVAEDRNHSSCLTLSPEGQYILGVLDTAPGSSDDVTPVLPVSRTGKWIVVAVLFLALFLRVAVTFESRSDYRPETDARHFDLIATSLANGDGYGDAVIPVEAVGPSALRAPLYPVSLAAVYAVFGDHDWTAGRLANAALGTLLVAMIGLVAALLWTRRIAFVAMAIAAVHPTLVLVGSSLNLEPLLVTLSLATLAAALYYRRSPRGLALPIVTGVLLGLSILTRELGFILLLPVAWLLWTARPYPKRSTPTEPGRWSRAALTAPVVAVLAAFVVVIPWTIVNYVRLDSFVPVTTSSGYGLAGTYNETARANRAEWIGPDFDPETAAIINNIDDPTEVNIDKRLRTATIDFIKEHPTYPVEVAFWNSVRLFDLDGGDYNRSIAPFVPYPGWLTKLSIVASFGILILAIIGAFFRAARRVPLAVWAIPVLTYVFMVITLPASIRYRASLEPFFVLLAALPVAAVLDRVLARRAAAAPEPSPTITA
jgi:4-amino-4-deoxy-L-arabinose transferase-like glycosyltransferase